MFPTLIDRALLTRDLLFHNHRCETPNARLHETDHLLALRIEKDLIHPSLAHHLVAPRLSDLLQGLPGTATSRPLYDLRYHRIPLRFLDHRWHHLDRAVIIPLLVASQEVAEEAFRIEKAFPSAVQSLAQHGVALPLTQRQVLHLLSQLLLRCQMAFPPGLAPPTQE